MFHLLYPDLYSVLVQRRKWDLDCCNSWNSEKWRGEIQKSRTSFFRLTSILGLISLGKQGGSVAKWINMLKEKICLMGQISMKASFTNWCVNGWNLNAVKFEKVFSLKGSRGKKALLVENNYYRGIFSLTHCPNVHLLLFLCFVSKSHSSTYLSLGGDCY